jgi:predicted enzyme related to lactoylglutathione lyase
VSVVDVTMIGMNDRAELTSDPVGTGESSGMRDTSVAARLGIAVIDTDDPLELAAFYHELLGWPYDEADEEWVCIVGPGGVELGFQMAINHRPPTWPRPEVPQQLHLDFHVDDLAAAIDRAVQLGARPAGVNPGRTFVTLIDPSGHPFCLCLAPELREAPLQ